MILPAAVTARRLFLASRKARDFSFFVFALRPFPGQGTTKLDVAEAEAVAQGVRRLAQFLELGAAVGVEQIKLLLAVPEPAEGHAQQTDPAAAIAMLAKEGEKMRKSVGVKPYRFRRSP